MRSSVLFTLLLGAILPAFGFAKEVFHETKDVQYLNNTRMCEEQKDLPNQVGFIKVGDQNEDAKMWFWFYESRKAGSDGPLVLVVGGGPGVAASHIMMDGTGPCVVPEKHDYPINNRYHSLNEWASVLYVDAPIGTGFSTGNTYIDNTEMATEYMLQFLGKFFDEFPKLRRRKFGIWSIDYGAHLATSLGVEILKKNKEAVKKGYKGDYRPISFDNIGFDSPHLDLTLQHKAAIEYAHDNDWIEVITAKDRDALLKDFVKYEKRWNDCGKHRYLDCTKEIKEHKVLWNNLTDGRVHGKGPSLSRYVDFENILKPRKNYNHEMRLGMMLNSRGARWLRSQATQKKLGLMGGKINGEKIEYMPFSARLHDDFWKSGDVIRSSLPHLDTLLQAGIRTLFVTGDTDFVTNHIGVTRIAEGIEFDGQEAFKKAKFFPILASRGENGDKDGEALWYTAEVGYARTAGPLTVVRYTGVGHYVGERSKLSPFPSQSRSGQC
ncbi:Alpha/Beta hydrolase protein [Ilyonectria sp. MPI-CAGE-AT-0026]|nr:Alpha/Beta hydrolase protein [Ilyonectria sp. MPI-CAGE-AT-0026]